MDAPRSWNGYPRLQPQLVHRLQTPLLPQQAPRPWIAHGLGRSYGDVCLNGAGSVLLTRGLDHFLAFDAEQGLLRCQAGVSFDEILRVIVPRGWFLPVTPGTRFVTVGGAVANDVHGKNHHRAGSFGCHVTRLMLRRSDGHALECAQGENPELFAATIGGLGLTGLIEWVELRLLRIDSAVMEEQGQRFERLQEFFDMSRDSDADWDYTVAWVDCAASSATLGRGVFYRGRHAPHGAPALTPPRRRSVPLMPPFSLVNRTSVGLFNRAYFARAGRHTRHRTVHYETFFYPLDAVLNWNRIYGPRGFLQHQCVIPDRSRAAVAELFREIARSGEGSFLAVLKMFGDKRSAGLLSFPRAGTTLALDFPIRGARTFALLDRLDRIVMDAGGAIYPAKDARMSPAAFRAGYPRLEAFARHVDPAFSSAFWQRVMQGT